MNFCQRKGEIHATFFTHRNTNVIATYTSICSVKEGDGKSLFLGHVDHCNAVEDVSGTGGLTAERQS